MSKNSTARLRLRHYVYVRRIDRLSTPFGKKQNQQQHERNTPSSSLFIPGPPPNFRRIPSSSSSSSSSSSRVQKPIFPRRQATRRKRRHPVPRPPSPLCPRATTAPFASLESPSLSPLQSEVTAESPHPKTPSYPHPPPRKPDAVGRSDGRGRSSPYIEASFRAQKRIF